MKVWIKSIGLAVGLCVGLAFSKVQAENTYRTRAFAPSHRLDLQRSIAECMAKVRAAVDPDSRTRYQEELCKKLIQAEEYDRALQVAKEVAETQGANPERRAVHHFLIAQIYAMRMESSPNVALMEENRQQAIRAAQEVIQRQYPKKWLVTESAKQLLRTLNDPKHLREVRGWVEKREASASFASKLLTSQIQSVQLDRGVKVGGVNASGDSSLSPSETRPLARGTVTVTFSRAEGDSRSASTVQRDSSGSERKVKTFTGPIVIEGTKVHAMRKLESVPPRPTSPYAPGAAPTVASPLYPTADLSSETRKQ